MATGCQNKKEFIFCRKTYHSCLSIELIINMLFRNNRTTGTDPYKTKQRGQTPTKQNSGDRPLQTATAGTDPYKTKQRGQTPTKRNSGDRPLQNGTTGTDLYKTEQRGQTPTKRNNGDRPLQNGTTGTDP